MISKQDFKIESWGEKIQNMLTSSVKIFHGLISILLISKTTNTVFKQFNTNPYNAAPSLKQWP
jgi:hypothetical protein